MVVSVRTSLFIPGVLEGEEDRGCVSPSIIQQRDLVLLSAVEIETQSGKQRSKWRVRREREIE